MQQIVAIGGGSSSETVPIYKYLVTLTGKPHPKVCFLPQASAEDKNSLISFYETFVTLGAQPSWLSLFGRVSASWKELLFQQDLIYVGGGNTKSMLALWRDWGVDLLLKSALERGTLLAGVSAGAICWFEQAITDSIWPLTHIPALGWLKGSCCPHYDGEKERRPAFHEMVKNGAVCAGLALQDGVAAHFIDGRLHKCLSCRPQARAYSLMVQEGVVVEEALACELVIS
jgi:peptidase E